MRNDECAEAGCADDKLPAVKVVVEQTRTFDIRKILTMTGVKRNF